MSDAFAPPPAPGGDTSAEQRQWAMFAHLSAIVGGLLTSIVGGWGTFAGPLIIWLVKKDTMPFVDDQAKEALNFNITIAIIALIMTIITMVTFGIGIIFTGPILVIVGIAWLVLTIIAAMKANEGQSYRYPFALRLIK